MEHIKTNMNLKLQKVVELTLTTFYLFNQISKGKSTNSLGKIILTTSILCILNSLLFTHYAQYSSIITLKDIEFDIEKLSLICEKMGEILFISSIFYTNNNIFSKIYGLIRIPTFVYLDSIKHMFDSTYVQFVTNLIFGIEFLLGALFILLNPIWSSKPIKNGGSLVICYVAYAFTCYLITLFKLPFELTENNIEKINVINSVMNTVLYLLMANALSHRKEKQVCFIRNPDKIAQTEEQKMKALIEFNEKY